MSTSLLGTYVTEVQLSKSDDTVDTDGTQGETLYTYLHYLYLYIIHLLVGRYLGRHGGVNGVICSNFCGYMKLSDLNMSREKATFETTLRDEHKLVETCVIGTTPPQS